MAVLSFKLQPEFLREIEAFAQEHGLSKGAVIRQALENHLQKKRSLKDRFKTITEQHQQSKKIQMNCDWEALYKKTRIKTKLTPEEEVLLSRSRGL